MLQTLNSDLFELNRKLQVIDFSGNELMLIGENILLPLNYLESADFTSNDCVDRLAAREEIQSLVAYMERECSSPDISKYLRSPTDLRSVNLECSFPNYSEISTENLHGRGCVINNLINPSPNQTVVSVNGGNDTVYDHVKLLFFRGKTVKYLPIGIGKFFPHLKTLIVLKTKLMSITQSDLKQFSKLESIYVWTNIIESIDDNLFELNPEVQRIDFGMNRIKVLGENIFKPLAKLEDVSFWVNNIETLDTDLFKHNPEIRSLDFSDNKIRSVGEDIFKPLTKLQTASFARNICCHKNAESQIEISELIADIITHCTIIATNQLDDQ